MVDIAKCRGDNCPLRETCYRFTSTANPYWQTFSAFVPFTDPNTGEVKCDAYWMDVRDNVGK